MVLKFGNKFKRIALGTTQGCFHVLDIIEIYKRPLFPMVLIGVPSSLLESGVKRTCSYCNRFFKGLHEQVKFWNSYNCTSLTWAFFV